MIELRIYTIQPEVFKSVVVGSDVFRVKGMKGFNNVCGSQTQGWILGKGLRNVRGIKIRDGFQERSSVILGGQTQRWISEKGSVTLGGSKSGMDFREGVQ